MLENRPDASETYDGVELQLIKSFSDGWMARVSFAWNDARQHIGPGAISDPNNEAPGTNVSGPILYGGQINARWQFNVSGTFPLPWGILGGVNLFGREGFPAAYSVFVATGAIEGVPNASLIQIGPATAIERPRSSKPTSSSRRPFLVGGVAIIPTFDCFNLFNSRTILGRGGARRRPTRSSTAADVRSARRLQHALRHPRPHRVPRRRPDRVLAGAEAWRHFSPSTT